MDRRPPDGPTAGAGASPLARRECPPECAADRPPTAGVECRAAEEGRPAEKETWTVNKVLLTGRLTRDPEMRSTATGKAVTQFSIATNEYVGQGKEKAE